VGVRRDLEDLAVTTGREQNRLRPEDMKLAGGELVSDDPATNPVHHQQVEDEEFVEEVHALFVALLEERLQDHVTGAVGRVASSLDRSFTVVPRVAAEPALVDPSVRGAVERQAETLELEDRVDGFLAHDVDGILIREEVPTLDGVECMPLPRVVLDVRKCRAHPSLGGTRVGSRRVQLRDDRGLHALAGF
jgi:hypothetical protein